MEIGWESTNGDVGNGESPNNPDRDDATQTDRKHEKQTDRRTLYRCVTTQHSTQLSSNREQLTNTTAPGSTEEACLVRY
jgi:hypothetical protein